MQVLFSTLLGIKFAKEPTEVRGSGVSIADWMRAPAGTWGHALVTPGCSVPVRIPLEARTLLSHYSTTTATLHWDSRSAIQKVCWARLCAG